MRNVEYKAELRDLELARGCLRASGAMHIVNVRQRDTHFRVPHGRLLKREAMNEPVEWIFYHRTDRISPRTSTFTILSDEQARTRWGTIGIPEWVTVEKTRDLWMTRNVTIALDQVEGLGTFCEVTAMLALDVDRHGAGDLVLDVVDLLHAALGEGISSGYAEMVAEGRGLDQDADLFAIL